MGGITEAGLNDFDGHLEEATDKRYDLKENLREVFDDGKATNERWENSLYYNVIDDLFTNIEGMQHADDSPELKTHFESAFQSLSNAIEKAHDDGKPTIAQELAKLYGHFCNAFEAGIGRSADFYRGNIREAYRGYL